jgi:hypothetical protein
MSEAHGTPPVDVSRIDPGLQPVLIALLYGFPGLALIVLLVRFWRRKIEKQLGVGKFSGPIRFLSTNANI